MNTLTICRKELNSYFRSPIAYGVMFFFAVITGYFFYAYVVSFVTFQYSKLDAGAERADERE